MQRQQPAGTASMIRGDNRQHQSKQQQHQQKAQPQASRELCGSCKSRVDAVIAGVRGPPPGEFRLFQTSMPDYAVVEVKQKLVELAKGAAAPKQAESEKETANSDAEEATEAVLGQELSRYMEGRFGGAWNVIVGEDFAASIIYGANSFLHCAVGGVSYLLFSWQPVSLFDNWSGASVEKPY